MPGYGFEPVLVENDWYDGPRSGLAYVWGKVCYFQCVRGYSRPGDAVDEFHVWPASEEAVAWEQEQWAIFTDWNDEFEAGTTTVQTHPARGGINGRYDQLQRLLAPHRVPPPNARRAFAELRFMEVDKRFHRDGPDYECQWLAL
ncbi:hypothetical protein [Catelliglobosispora koreensis]|uniref:hypothetical protein n=1 Tax=Catelliglobosispora koreensis TaxID=129052 RepID=UPI00036ADC7A|nr:hypothetical protein [Catelliglobosispora koreensis]